MDRRPSLVVSPRRLRPRPHRAPRPPLVPSSAVQPPPGSIKKARSMRASVCAIPSPIRHQPSPMRSSVSALPSAARLDLSPPASARAAGKENVPTESPQARSDRKEDRDHYADRNERVALDLAALARVATPVAGPLFVRGRLYDLYSTRRDERLKRKHGFPYGGEWASPGAMVEDPCVAVELSKRRVSKKTACAGGESVRRSMPAREFAGAGRTSALGTRSSLRSSTEMKKASAASGAMSVATKKRRVNSRSSYCKI